jgi:uncharacterized protein YacL (UPF0231 family)
MVTVDRSPKAKRGETGLFDARDKMGTERIRKLEEEIASVRAKLEQLEAQIEKAKECEKKAQADHECS